jgi:hypothetical protein
VPEATACAPAVVGDTLMRTIELGVRVTDAAVDEKATTITCTPVTRDPRCPDCGTAATAISVTNPAAPRGRAAQRCSSMADDPYPIQLIQARRGDLLCSCFHREVVTMGQDTPSSATIAETVEPCSQRLRPESPHQFILYYYRSRRRQIDEAAFKNPHRCCGGAESKGKSGSKSRPGSKRVR